MRTERIQSASDSEALIIAADLLLYPDAVNLYAAAYLTTEPLEMVRVHIVSSAQEVLFTRWRLIPMASG